MNRRYATDAGGPALNVNVHTHALVLARRIHRVIVPRRVLAEEAESDVSDLGRPMTHATDGRKSVSPAIKNWNGSSV